MNRLILKSRLDAQGTLHLPIDPAQANCEVQVTIEPAPSTMSQEEWQKFILSIAGSIPDPTFRRHEQGEFELRESLP